jgi:hypothetical protein
MAERETAARAVTPTGSARAWIARGIAIAGAGFLGSSFAGVVGLEALRPALAVSLVVGLIVLAIGVYKIMAGPGRALTARRVLRVLWIGSLLPVPFPFIAAVRATSEGEGLGSFMVGTVFFAASVLMLAVVLAVELWARRAPSA